MATYIIGDIQGCYRSLMTLLEKLDFNEQKDTLYLLGDLVNRGPGSLDVLRYVSRLPNCQAVLGNHDLHLLAIDEGIRDHKATDTLQDILQADDKEALLNWLASQAFYLHLEDTNNILIHAGVPPQFKAMQLFDELAQMRQWFTDDRHAFLEAVFANEAVTQWQDDLSQAQKIHFLMNAITRIRFCTKDKTIDYSFKGTLSQGKEQGFIPWYEACDKSFREYRIFFGHWAALNGRLNNEQFLALDTGCVWGGKLSAYNVKKDEIIAIPADLKDVYQ